MSSFPIYRPRRLRRTETLRSMVRETVVRPRDLVLPLFVLRAHRRSALIWFAAADGGQAALPLPPSSCPMARAVSAQLAAVRSR